MITWMPDGTGIVFNRSGGAGAGGGGGGGRAADRQRRRRHDEAARRRQRDASDVLAPARTWSAFPRLVAQRRRCCSAGASGARGQAAAVQPAAVDAGHRSRHRARALDARRQVRHRRRQRRRARVAVAAAARRAPAKKLDTGDASPNSSFFVDMAINKDGAIAFTGTSPTRPAELYYMASPAAPGASG